MVSGIFLVLERGLETLRLQAYLGLSPSSLLTPAPLLMMSRVLR